MSRDLLREGSSSTAVNYRSKHLIEEALERMQSVRTNVQCELTRRRCLESTVWQAKDNYRSRHFCTLITTPSIATPLISATGVISVVTPLPTLKQICILFITECVEEEEECWIRTEETNHNESVTSCPVSIATGQLISGYTTWYIYIYIRCISIN